MSNFDKLVQARIDKTGESWATAARQVRAQAPTSGKTDDTGLIVNQPRFRHVSLGNPTEYEIEAFTFNQTVSSFYAKFKGWSGTRHWLEPVYHHVGWANEDGGELPDGELRALADMAINTIRRDGYALVVHAPGRLAMMVRLRRSSGGGPAQQHEGTVWPLDEGYRPAHRRWPAP